MPATKHGSSALKRGKLTSVLSTEAFSPHETHSCVLGSVIDSGGSVRALRGLELLGIGGWYCLLIWRCTRTGFQTAFGDLECCLFVVEECWMETRDGVEIVDLWLSLYSLCTARKDERARRGSDNGL